MIVFISGVLDANDVAEEHDDWDHEDVGQDVVADEPPPPG
jgi:hypothetical protein